MTKKADETEIRSFEGIELRSEEGKPSMLVGYAATFDSISKDLGGFFEVIRKGAFARSLASGDEILALAYHDPYKPLARRSAGTLRLSEDDKGLRVEMDLNSSTTARDTLADVQSQNVKGMSFRFKTIKAVTNKRESGLPLRELLVVKLIEVSTTTIPAYNDTSIAARSIDEALKAENPDNSKACKRLNAARERLLTITFHNPLQ